MENFRLRDETSLNRRGALIAVYLTAVLNIAFGIAGLFGLFGQLGQGNNANINLVNLAYGASVIVGVVIILSTFFSLIVAEFLTCGALILLSSISLATSAQDAAPILAYFVSIALAGVLIGGNIIPIISVVAIIAYFVTLASNNELLNSADPVLFVGATVITATLLTLFSNAQRRTAEEAREVAAQLAVKNAQLEAAFAVQQQTRSEALVLAGVLNTTSQTQKSTADSAATAISQITAQSAELSAASSQIAAAARHIREVGEQTRDLASEARERLESDRDQLNQAVRAGEQLQEAARSVSDKVKQMSQILSLITEVAEETHMLSLNATIEATGTGEAGRRFRVIAAEVGNLANKVNSSTEQVTSIVQNVQRTAQQMLATANQTVDTIRRSQVASTATGEQIYNVTEAAENVAHEGFAIVASTEQQRRSTDLIADAMQQVSTLARGAADGSGQLAEVAGELTDSVNRLSADLPAELLTVHSGNGSAPPPPTRGPAPTTRLELGNAG